MTSGQQSTPFAAEIWGNVSRRPDECRDSFELERPWISDELSGKVDPAEPSRFADKRHRQAEEGMEASDLAGRRHGQAVLAGIPRDPELADCR